MRVTSKTFSYGGNVALFNDSVTVRDPRGAMTCDLLTVVTGASNQVQRIIAQRNVADDFQRDMRRDFEIQIAAQHAARDVRFALLSERCRQLVEARIRAAFEDGAADIYPLAQQELPSLELEPSPSED